MNAVLICPSHIPAVAALERKRPLVLAPFLGQTVLEYGLAHLAALGVKHVRLLVPDRASQVEELVKAGEAWGLTLETLSGAVAEELIAAGSFNSPQLLTLDHLPQLPDHPLWRSYRDWYVAQQVLIAKIAPQRVGMREITPGVFVGLRSKVAVDATLSGPCWIGAGVHVGSRVVIGAGTVVEDGSYIEEGAELHRSIVGPGTYVGKFTEILDSFAWGNSLLSFESGSVAEVSDPFLLSEVRTRKGLTGGLLDALWGPRTVAPNSPPEAISHERLPAGLALEPQP